MQKTQKERGVGKRFWYSGWRSDRRHTLGLAGAGVGTVSGGVVGAVGGAVGGGLTGGATFC